jgi:hypothetical protein
MCSATKVDHECSDAKVELLLRQATSEGGEASDGGRSLRGRSFADGREYEEVDPNYQVADLLVAARKSPNASHLDLDRAPESVIG